MSSNRNTDPFTHITQLYIKCAINFLLLKLKHSKGKNVKILNSLIRVTPWTCC